MINVYAIQILLVCFFGYLFRNDKKKFLITAFLVLFVVMAFRNARLIGNDSTSSYYYEFSAIQSTSLPWPNPGLPIIMRIVRIFTADYQWVIIVTASWVCFAYYRLLVKYSENAFISVMWFMGMLFYTFLFSALKQAWAMTFLCFAFDAVFEKKPVRFLLFVSLAALFHFPALIFLPAFWVAKLRINRAFPLLMFGSLVIVYVFRTPILNLMVSAYSQGANEYSSSSSFFGTKFILMLIILIFAFYRYFKFDKGNEVFSSLLYFMGLAAVIQTFCFYDNIFERLADYYYQFSILFMPLILKRNVTDIDTFDRMDLVNNASVANDAVITKKRISTYTINDVDISTVLAVVITFFCIWRFISYTGDRVSSLTPFYFFWDGVTTGV